MWNKERVMIELNAGSKIFVSGGKCSGVWLGTSDGEYGICIGKSES